MADFNTIDFSNQTDIFDPSKFGHTVHFVGAGGIGSASFLQLISIGVRELHIYDDDHVEEHNVPNQLLYKRRHIGMPKVFAAKHELDDFGFDAKVVPHFGKVTSDTVFNDGIVISGVDSMSSREQIWSAVMSNAANIPLYMDGRVGGENLQLIIVNPMDIDLQEAYEEYYLGHTDDQIAELPCAARAVIHPVGTLGNWIVSKVTQFYRGLDLPFVEKMDMLNHYYSIKQPPTSQPKS